MAQVVHEKSRPIYHLGGGAVLHRISVDRETHGQRGRVRNFIDGGEPWASRVEGLAGLALRPLALALNLKLSLAHIITDHVSSDVLESFLLIAEVTATRTDDYRQFDLPVRLFRILRNVDGVVRTNQRIGRLREDDGLRRYLGTCLCSMVCVVEADADDLVRSGDG